jgi:hypothetical protein
MVDLTPERAKYDWPRRQEARRSSIDEEAFGLRLQAASRRGRPLGDEQFVENLEERCGRRLRAQPVGRPKKAKEEGGIGCGWDMVFECAVPSLRIAESIHWVAMPPPGVRAVCG